MTMSVEAYKQVKLSIIIPVYNKSQYLPRLISNIDEQGYDDFEVIMINDGSTDCSIQLFDDLAAQYSWLRVFHQENAGVSAARNRGLSLAVGLYVLFIDADDFFSEKALMRTMEVVEATNADICLYNYSMVLDHTILPNTKSEIRESPMLTKIDDFEPLFFELLRLNILGNIGTKVYKKEILSNIAFIPYNICEDLSFCVDAICKANLIAFFDEPLYLYQQDVSGSLMSVYKKNYLNAACILIGKIDAFRAQIKGSTEFDKQYLSYKDAICKSIIWNEEKRGVCQCKQLCDDMVSRPEFLDLINSSEHGSFKDAMYYSLLRNKMGIFICFYYWLKRVLRKGND